MKQEVMKRMNGLMAGAILMLFMWMGTAQRAVAVEAGDSLKLAQFKSAVQPYLDVENNNYLNLLGRYVNKLDSLASSGKKVKKSAWKEYQPYQPQLLRQVVLGDVTLRDTFLQVAQTALQQKYPDRKVKYWKTFSKVLDKAATNFLSEYADVAVVQWEADTQSGKVNTPRQGAGPIIVGNDEDLVHFVPGGSVVRRVLYRESEVNPKPQFPGGETAYRKYLRENVKYPAEALKKKIQGSVRVGFTVKADGTISNVKLERKVSPLLDQEALRVVKSMPKWKPGCFEGKPVPVKMTLPVQFKLTVTKK